MTNYLTASSRKFCMKFCEIGGARPMIKLLANEKFVDDPANESCVHLILLNVTLLASESDFHKKIWQELGAINTLLKLGRKNNKFKRPAYSSVLKIANDSEISEIHEIFEIATIFINSMTKAAEEMLAAGESVKRDQKEFNADPGNKNKSKLFDVYHVIDEDDVRYPVTSVMNTIYKLSVNDKIKYDLYVKLNAKDPLRVFIFHGSDIEKRYALKLLTQLCFDPQVQEEVHKDAELMKLIENNTNEQSESYLSKTFKQILWFFNLKKVNEDNEEKISRRKSVQQAHVGEKEQKQIMISYNSASRDLCLKIKGELEKIGFKVWIDVDDIHGSSLESMANAIETSDVVLMCVTEKYRQSNNCQAEAQYAFKLEKPIIPIIMQENYGKVGGWLGIIMGDRIYVNFTKHEFNEAITRLKSQISKLLAIEEPIIENAQQEFVMNSQVETTNDVVAWSDQDVKSWFEKVECSSLYESLKPCNGELLQQLNDMRKNAPEFFYQFIWLDKSLDRRTLLLFANNFRKLFEN